MLFKLKTMCITEKIRKPENHTNNTESILWKPVDQKGWSMCHIVILINVDKLNSIVLFFVKGLHIYVILLDERKLSKN